MIKYIENYKRILKEIQFKLATNELQQTTFNHLLDIGFEDYMSLYKTCIARPYFFLVIDNTLASDNLLYFRRNLLEIE